MINLLFANMGGKLMDTHDKTYFTPPNHTVLPSSKVCQCRFLREYSPGKSSWKVSSCIAKHMPYVPSLLELDKFCRGNKHVLCPVFILGLGSSCMNKDSFQAILSAC